MERKIKTWSNTQIGSFWFGRIKLMIIYFYNISLVQVVGKNLHDDSIIFIH